MSKLSVALMQLAEGYGKPRFYLGLKCAWCALWLIGLSVALKNKPHPTNLCKWEATAWAWHFWPIYFLTMQGMDDTHYVSEITAVDNMIFNAYGTVYKLAVKYASARHLAYKLSSTEEMLSAKNVVTNLWSVLDYCCIILHSKHNGVPTPKKASSIKFPCYCKQATQQELAEWERNLYVKMLGLPICDYIKFKGAFSGIQKFQNEQHASHADTLTFYRLHFLRNTLTHNTTYIYKGRVDFQTLNTPDFKKITTENDTQVMTIEVPKEPWSEKAWSEKAQEVDNIPLLDVLFQACKVVEDRRDKLLHTLDEGKFSRKYAFNVTEKHLTVTFDDEGYKMQHSHLHLECYGMQAEIKKFNEAVFED